MLNQQTATRQRTTSLNDSPDSGSVAMASRSAAAAACVVVSLPCVRARCTDLRRVKRQAQRRPHRSTNSKEACANSKRDAEVVLSHAAHMR